MKLQELIMRLSKFLESLLVDQVCFARVALIFILLRPSDVQGCLCHSYSLSLHISVNVQGLCAGLCLLTQNAYVCQLLLMDSFFKVAKLVRDKI